MLLSVINGVRRSEPVVFNHRLLYLQRPSRTGGEPAFLLLPRAVETAGRYCLW